MMPRWDWTAAVGGIRVGVRTSRREHTTSTVIIHDDQAILVDPAWDPDELASIADDLSGADITVAAGFATHPHHDHLLWHPGLGDAPRWASRVTAEAAARGRNTLRHALGPSWPTELADLVGMVTALDSDRMPWNGPDVALITHNAHAPGHTALWIPDAGVLVAGDMLSDVEIPLLEESSTTDYEQGLAALRPYAAVASLLVPGHGSVAVGPAAAQARWQADHDYLRDLSAATTGTDRRLRNPGMRSAHRQNRSRAEQAPG
jgi:hydroxyacylglutathione hydrolase